MTRPGHEARDRIPDAGVPLSDRPAPAPGASLDQVLSAVGLRLERAFADATSMQELDGTLSGDAFIGRVMGWLYDGLRPFVAYDRLGLALVCDDGRSLRGFWGRSEDESGPDPMAGYEAPLAGSSLQRLLLTNRPRVIRDLDTYQAEAPQSEPTRRIRALGMRSNLAFPIRSLDRPVGVVFFSCRAANAYGQGEADRLGAVAEHVGRLIEMGRLYQQVLSLRPGILPRSDDRSRRPEVNSGEQGSTKVLDKRLAIGLEPDEATRGVFAEVLGRIGLEAALCADMSEFGALLRERPCDVLILAATMCGGVMPQQVAECMAGSPGHAPPALILTCPEHEKRLRQCCIMCPPADDVLLLPFRPAELETRIRLAVRRRFLKNSGGPASPAGGVFAGRYRVDHEIYCGGYSSVYLAYDVGAAPNARPLALKVYCPSPAQARGRKFVSLFLHETHRHFHLEHPRIAPLLDFGQTNGLYFLVTEYVPGRSLASVISETGTLETRALVRVGMDVADVLAYLHGNGLVHRDVKPQNIIITPEGDARPIDFGLARSHADMQRAPHDSVDGTPMYLAPEIRAGNVVPDIKTDVYALGVTLFHAATGRFPVQVTDADCGEIRIAPGRPLSLREAAPHLCPALCRIVDRMLAPQPGQRPAPETIRNDLKKLLG